MRKEHERLIEDKNREVYWKRWGPYLSERAWGTVREDYSANGDAWGYFTFDQARSRAYRWNEDGIAGFCDRHQLICFAVAMWNGHDPFLKERLFGLSGQEGNHGEDVKECYFYLDNTPTHSYMKALYKYPQQEFPYPRLIEENRRRTRLDPEFELMDTGIFDDGRYFDVFVEYAKATSEDILIRITAWNRGPETARLHLLPTIWFRNLWSWKDDPEQIKPKLERMADVQGMPLMRVYHPQYGERWLFAEGSPQLLFTENESNLRRLFNAPNRGFYQKDGINDYVVKAQRYRINAEQTGTKASAYYDLEIAPGESAVVKLVFTENINSMQDHFGKAFDEVFHERILDADEFYRDIIPQSMSPEGRNIMRQGFAGMLWSKQFYNYDVRTWLAGDPAQPPPPKERLQGRNHDWSHFYSDDIISMPDKWEYPWFAAWDLAFHCVPLALMDWNFAKDQLTLLCREWYMHPNGQLPAYEWNFSDVNPPVHAWAAHRVYQIERRMTGKGDFAYLERIFHKLLINFTWWVNRKDTSGNNIFEGGFLGLDNIGAFDRSMKFPSGVFMEQSDGTSWMATYSLSMLMIALDLAMQDPVYEDTAIKFWEHFLYIVNAMNRSIDGEGIWDEEQGFYYDVLHVSDGEHIPMRIRSIVGLVPLFAVQTLEPGLMQRLPNFAHRIQWYLEHRPDLTRNIACFHAEGVKERQLLAIVDEKRLRRILQIMLDEKEFLSPYGIRSISQFHRDHPFKLEIGGRESVVDYEPGESTTSLFGGNSNWRGPIWFPVNFLIIEALQRYHHYYGDKLKVECPTGSGNSMNLGQVAAELSDRLAGLFTRNAEGKRPAHGRNPLFQSDPYWKDLVLFYEYFHADTGAGLGASHQTGWTGLIAKLMQQNGEPQMRRVGASANARKQTKVAK
ncbi:MAG: glucosidase [Acidobacteria bacterium]|nr:MAG: glucosidase [Acidobacteriota bacterium]